MNAAPAVSLEQFVDINGQSQWLAMRGDDASNPVLLIVSGPGVALSRMADFFAPWQEHFTLVHWDQPNAGATLTRGAAPVALSIERLVQDAIAVSEFVCRELGARKIAVLGISGGTIVALHLIKRRPDLFSAYVGTGQIVNWAHQDFLSYETLLDEARSTNNATMLAELKTLGEPPYASTAQDAVKSKFAAAFTAAEKQSLADLDPGVVASMSEDRTAAVAAYQALRAEIVEFDAHLLGLEFAVPMFFLQGELDVYTVTSEVWLYAEEILAPQKEFDLIDGGGHSVFLMRDAFLAALNFHVREVAVKGAMQHE